MQHRRALKFSMLLCFGVFSSLDRTAVAQGDPVRVTKIHFNKEKLFSVDNDWLEFEVAVEAGRNPDPAAANARYIDNVRVALNVSFRIGSGRSLRYGFYRSEVLIVALEQGVERTVYFYLPSEVVERDRLSCEPFAYLIELEAEGRPLPVRRDHVSSNLADPARVERFKARVAAEGRGNEGVLLPIYQTPFYINRDKLQKSPAFIRKPS